LFRTNVSYRKAAPKGKGRRATVPAGEDSGPELAEEEEDDGDGGVELVGGAQGHGGHQEEEEEGEEEEAPQGDFATIRWLPIFGVWPVFYLDELYPSGRERAAGLGAQIAYALSSADLAADCKDFPDP